MTTSLAWESGGPLADWPAPLAWGFLVLLAAGGIALIFHSYRRTLRPLRPVQRWVLTAIRSAMLLVALLCLANPVRVQREAPAKTDRTTLSVLVDRSDSMDRPDYRGSTRLADAARTWRTHERAARTAFGDLSYATFAERVEPADTLDAAVAADVAGSSTHLYAALRQAIAANPAAVACLTDGLDTSGTEASDVVREALELGVPLYFVAGKNRTLSGMAPEILSINAPASVLRQSRFNATVLLQTHEAKDGSLPVELWSRGAKLAEAALPVRTGRNSLTWRTAVNAGEPGLLPVEFRIARGAGSDVSSCTVRVVEKKPVELLFYQGALQWGSRFLRIALQEDPSFRVTAMVDPSLGMRNSMLPPVGTPSDDLPDDVKELERFQIILLAHVDLEELTSRQQEALVAYARGGGGLLFVAPDAESARQFSGSILEQMLPVVFEPPARESGEAIAERNFQQTMSQLGGSQPAMESVFARDIQRKQTVDPLLPFVCPNRKSPSTKYFSQGAAAPHFVSYVPVERPKSGAEVVAVHPTETANGKPRVLLARQNFGSGFSAALTTDLLWRWKLSLPSASKTFETFWQQFLLSLAPPSREPGLRLLKTGARAAVNQPLALKFEAGGANTPDIVSISPDGRRTPLAAEPPSAPGAAGLVPFVPAAPGRWEIEASSADGLRATLTIAVPERAPTLENSPLPPDREGLRLLAESTGGRLLEEGTNAFTAPAIRLPEPAPVRTPLWNTAGLFFLLLGLYGSELVIRRLFRLL